MTSTFSTRLTGVFRKRVSNCPASIVVGLPFRMTVTSPAPAKVNLPPISCTPGNLCKAS